MGVKGCRTDRNAAVISQIRQIHREAGATAGWEAIDEETRSRWLKHRHLTPEDINALEQDDAE